MFLFFLYLINLYIRPQDWLSLVYAWPVDYLIIIPALLVGFMTALSESHKLVRLPQYILIIALLVVIFLSNAVHGNFEFGIAEFTLFYKKACIFLMTILLIKSTNRLKISLFFMVILSSIIAVQAIMQFCSGGLGMAGQDFYHSGEGVRTTWVGLWNGANSTALLLNISVPFALEFAFGPYVIFWRFINFILAGILIGGVYTTNSRGGFVTLLAILGLYPMFKVKNKRIAVIIGVILAMGALIYLAPSRAGQMDAREESAYVRTRLWGNAMDMFKENKILGVGKGKFQEENARNMAAHSNFMQNLAEIGGIGIFIWIALIYFSFKGLYYANRIKPHPRTRAEIFKSLSRATLISMIGFNICTLFITMDIDIFYLLLGLSAATVNILNKEVEPIKMEFSLPDFRNICIAIVGMLLFYHYFIR